MFQPPTRDQAMALAALFQATYAVKHIAWDGRVDLDTQEALINSIFRTDAENVYEIYGNPSNLSVGLTVLRGQLGGEARSRDMELTRYTATLLQLEKQLSKNPQMLGKIADGIRATREQLEHFPATHINTLSRLADIYQQTVSTLNPRVMVNGEHTHLDNPDNATRIRTMLLAGIRAAVLWRQCGGSRLRLLLGRSSLLRLVEELLYRNIQ